MLTKTIYHPVVAELQELIRTNHWEGLFEEAIKKANTMKVPYLEGITGLEQYLGWINAFLYWVPTEDAGGQYVDEHLSAFYFIADQEPLLSLQNKIEPYDRALPLSPFSQWLRSYALAMGEFMDTPQSLTLASELSFYQSPAYRMDEYLRPRGGWKCFNQFFARHYKPGYRPIAAIGDNSVIVSPADAVFVGQWDINEGSNITVKNINWQISELLEGSPYRERFSGGRFLHSYLSPTDYHRVHAPVAGRVLEARVIQGQVYLEVYARAIDDGSGGHSLHRRMVYYSPDNTGYQFAQTRGLIVLDSPIGLVAVLPVGMCQVSSVVITAEVGVSLHKGEELSYFQFGGSDVILLFERACNAHITVKEGLHYKMGNPLGVRGNVD